MKKKKTLEKAIDEALTLLCIKPSNYIDALKVIDQTKAVLKWSLQEHKLRVK